MNLELLFVTARSAVLRLDDPGVDYRTREYEIWLNGEKYASSEKTVETLYDLNPDSEYRVQARRDGELSAELIFCTKEEFVTLNVRDFGAKGDGVTDDTAFIQAAILSCPPKSRVLIPSGVFAVTNLFLKSDITLELTEGAELAAIPDKTRIPVLPGRIESYDENSEFIISSWEGDPLDSFASVITGMQVENVTICGRGTVNGRAGFDNWWDAEKRKNDPGRPRMMFLNHCKNAVIFGLTVKNSPSWNLHPFFCENVKICNLKIESAENSHNTDGINPESCTDVEISGVYFSVGDDCIAIKSGKLYMGKTYKTPSKNILIRNCLMEKGHGGVTVGSEIAAGVDNIIIKNCCFVGTDRGLRVKTRRGRGRDSYIRGIVFDRVRMEGVKTPFVINCFYYCGLDGKTEYVATKEKLPVDERTPRVGGIVIKNVVCTDCHAAGIYFYGLPELPIESVTLENVSISFAENAEIGRAAMMQGCEVSRKKGIFIRNAEQVFMKNVTIDGYEGECADIENVGRMEWI